jgi:hypothetical protein
MFDQLISILVLGAIATASYGIGRPLVRGLGIGRGDRLASAVWSVALGLVAAGLGLACLGMAGGLYASVIGVLTLTASFWAIGQVLRTASPGQAEETAFADALPEPSDEPEQTPWPSPPVWLRRLVLSLAAVACLASLVGALAPPTAGDALCYHLELPKRFLADHRLEYLPYDDNVTYPLLTEMWYLWALALDGGVAAQLVHWGLGVLLALAAVVLASPIVGRPWAWIAGGVVILVPGLNNQMTAPLNDLALTLMTTLALAAWWRAAVDQQSRRWFVVAGLATGGALGTKYLALAFAAAVAVPWAWAMLRHRHQRQVLLQGAGIVAVVAASVGGLWYVRAAWYRGNPVYPFACEVFDASGAPVPRAETLPAEKSPLGRSLPGLVTAPWHLTMHPERQGGRAHQLGVLFLAALPGLLLVRRLRGLGTLLVVAGAYFTVWYLMRQNVRFLYPVVPLLAVAVVWVWIEMRRMPRLPRSVAWAAVAVILLASGVVAASRCRDRLAVALGIESREEYLSRREPTYPAAAVANLLLDADSRILSQDSRGFYFEPPVTRENVFRRVTGYDRRIARPAELAERLRGAGFTHLLLVENLAERGVTYDPTLSRLADAELAAAPDGPLQELTEYRFCDSDGGVRRYRLVRVR